MVCPVALFMELPAKSYGPRRYSPRQRQQAGRKVNQRILHMDVPADRRGNMKNIGSGGGKYRCRDQKARMDLFFIEEPAG